MEWYIRASIDWWHIQIFDTLTSSNAPFVHYYLCVVFSCVGLRERPLVPTPSGGDNHSINQQSVYLLLESFHAIASVFVVQRPWTTASARLWSMDNKPLDHRSIGGSIERLQLFWTNFVQCENEEAKVSDCKRLQCISVRISFVVCLYKYN